MLLITVSKDLLAQKFLQETKLLKVNKTKNKLLEISEETTERAKFPQKEGIKTNLKTKDFSTPNLNSMIKIKEETWTNGNQNPNTFWKLSSTMVQMFSTLKSMKDRILKILWMISEESTIWARMQREDFLIRSNNRSIVE